MGSAETPENVSTDFGLALDTGCGRISGVIPATVPWPAIVVVADLCTFGSGPYAMDAAVKGLQKSDMAGDEVARKD